MRVYCGKDRSGKPTARNERGLEADSLTRGTRGRPRNGSSVANEYTYDDNGSMNKDLNKNVKSITYNPLNKVEKVLFNDDHYIIYRYDATGAKLAMITYNSDNTKRAKNEYAEGFVYTNKALSFFGSPEGRVVPNNVLPAGQAGSTEYQYTITDHLGNTRVLFTSAKPVAQSVTATFEGDSNDQSSQFTNVTPVVVSFSAANNTPGGNKVVRLNQSNPVGPGYSKKVYPGDKVDLQVFSYYEATSGYGTSTVSLSGMISVVTGALVGVGPDPGGLKANGVNSAINGFGIGANQGDTQPAAFLNYILFDANYKVMDAGWEVVPATSFLKQKMNIPTITVKEAGYIFAYLSYEDKSTNFVYFDDFKVTVTPTNILQSNEYYPFGLLTEKSWTRENTTNNFLYNGKELQAEADWYDYDARMYMPEIGRWGVVDPLTEKSRRWSPYTYAMDNPVRYIDPDGMEVTETDRGGLLYDGDDIAPIFSKILASLPNEEPEDRSTKSEKDDDEQRGYFSINQVLNKYGYDSKQEYLFPKPTFLQRMSKFLFAEEDPVAIAEVVVNSVTDEADRINQNLESVDIDNLEKYRSVLFNLRFSLMTKIETLDGEIAKLRANNPGGINNGQIIGLGNLKLDIKDELIPVNFDYSEVIKTLTNKKMQ